MNADITLILFVYNQVDTVEAAALSCLGQLGEPVEILFSDDASTDGSYEKLLEIAGRYQGPHRVRVRRNARNLGIGDHYNAAIADASGQLLITAAGDDISCPERVQTIAHHWHASGRSVDLMASYLHDMDANGVLHGVVQVDDLSRWKTAEDWFRHRPRVVGASHAFTKRMHQHFGDFLPGLHYEDQAMSFRACCLGGGLTIPKPLVKYRRGGVSSGVSPASSAQRLQKKYLRQAVTFSQVRADLYKQGLAHLWGGRPRRYWAQGQIMARYLETGQWRWLDVKPLAAQAGWWWLFRLWWRLRPV